MTSVELLERLILCGEREPSRLNQCAHRHYWVRFGIRFVVREGFVIEVEKEIEPGKFVTITHDYNDFLENHDPMRLTKSAPAGMLTAGTPECYHGDRGRFVSW